MIARVLGQDDIHGMGLIKGLHHIDAIAQRAREEHGVVDGGPESAGFIDSNGGAGRQHLGRDQLRRHCARRGGSLRDAANCATARAFGRSAGGELLLGKERPADRIPIWAKEQRPQLVWTQSLLMTGSNGVYLYNTRIVYQAEQVVCRPVNHSWP